MRWATLFETGDKIVMNRRYAQVFVICVVVPLAACSGTPETKSAFLSSFSTKDAIEKSFNSPDGAPGFSVNNGGTSESLGSRRVYHRNDRAELTIKEGDESSLLPRIKEQVEQQLGTSGCRINGSGSGTGSYSIGYTDGTAHGWIDIWGVRGIGDRYTIVVTITEF
jgi:hypothetical protein